MPCFDPLRGNACWRGSERFRTGSISPESGSTPRTGGCWCCGLRERVVVIAVLGLTIGIWRALGAARGWSQYRGTMRWHHGAGLIFGLLTLTWLFSGMLSLEPGHYSSGSEPTAMQREAFSGAADYSSFSAPPAEVLEANPSAKELQPYQVAGRPYYLVTETDQAT